MALIDLTHPAPAALAALQRVQGAFLWWYADLVSPTGDALVLIWALGLPFLPGSGKPSTPLARPALSLSLYRAGRPDFYLLQDYACGPEAALDEAGSGRLGGTQLRVSEVQGELTMCASVDEPIPGSRERVTGRIALRGRSTGVPIAPGGGAHHWAPRTCSALGGASLRIGARQIELEGSAYLDSNFSAVPLTQQGIDHWLWGRVAFQDRTVVFYQTLPERGEPETWLLEQTATGSLQPLRGTLRWERWRRTLYGLRAPRSLRVEAQSGAFSAVFGPPVDDGPFYQRFLVQARRHSGEPGYGVAELVAPGAIDRPWQRPFIRMRTHRVGGHNSVWLPLFSGSREGRVARLLAGRLSA